MHPSYLRFVTSSCQVFLFTSLALLPVLSEVFSSCAISFSLYVDDLQISSPEFLLELQAFTYRYSLSHLHRLQATSAWTAVNYCLLCKQRLTHTHSPHLLRCFLSEGNTSPSLTSSPYLPLSKPSVILVQATIYSSRLLNLLSGVSASSSTTLQPQSDLPKESPVTYWNQFECLHFAFRIKSKLPLD